MSLLDSVNKRLEEVVKNLPRFDPSRFDDDVAMQTEWGPIAGMRTSFSTQQLVEISPRRFEFRMRKTTWLFPGLLMLLGLSIVYWGVGSSSDVMPVVLIGGGLMAGGVALLRIWSVPRVFDKNAGRYWKGREPPAEPAGANACRLAEIHAIQLLKTSIGTGGSSSLNRVFELNLVFADGRRVNVVSHGHLGLIRSDAERLGAFLGVPVWDAVLLR